MPEQSPCWRDVEEALGAGLKRLLLYGPTGTGKTFAALTMGEPTLSRRPVCTEDLTSGDILGTWMPSGPDRWGFHEGPAIQAWRGQNGEGGRLVVDEVDRASGDALSQLLNVTDSELSARWINPETLQTVQPGPEFSVVMTTNVSDPWEIPQALRDRFPVAIKIDQPPIAAVEKLSADLRTAALAGTVTGDDRRLSLRALYAFDDLRRALNEDRAAELVFGRDRSSDIIDALRISRVD